jgi:hypothetical protein
MSVPGNFHNICVVPPKGNYTCFGAAIPNLKIGSSGIPVASR